MGAMMRWTASGDNPASSGCAGIIAAAADAAPVVAKPVVALPPNMWGVIRYDRGCANDGGAST